MTEATIEHEKRDSIELSKNAKGEYAWKVKLYFDDADETSPSVVDELAAINYLLKTKFG